MRGEILGLERRRRWSDDEKLAIVNSVGVGGATVTQVAQRHDLKRQQVYAWRHELKSKGLLPPAAETMFLPVEFLETGPFQRTHSSAPNAVHEDHIEVVLRNGRSLRVVADVNVAALVRLMNAVEAS
jgi:transposase|nr:transposase [Yoonia sp.]